MTETGKDYIVNFFRPQSPHARADMRLISLLVVIWTAAVFGFQFLLIALEKPTPEPSQTTFERVWPKVAAGSASSEEMQAFARTQLSVLGKSVVLKAEHRDILSQTLSAAVLAMLSEDERTVYTASVNQSDKNKAIELATRTIGLSDEGFDRLMIALLPSALVPVEPGTVATKYGSQLPSIMSRYLIHNQSGLTDFRFLGFPFHYWYTAQFLLILFVVLCLIYAVQIEKIHKKHGFIEE